MISKSCYRCKITKLCNEFVSYLMPYCVKCLEIYDLSNYKPDLSRHYSAKRRSQKLNATPTWMSQLQWQQIKSIYKEAVRLERLDGIPRHVDHIVPLVHSLVCGLNLPINLQILTATENLTKSNKFRPYIESEINRKKLLPWQA